MNDSTPLFEHLMKVGDVGERRVTEHYVSLGYTFLNFNQDNRYDVKLSTPDGREHLLEVKTDTTSSPNIAVETWSRNKPSGIYATQAHEYCVYFTQSGELWVFDVPKLKSELSDLMGLKLVPVRAIQGTGTWVKLLPKQLAQKLGLARPLSLESASQVTGISVLNRERSVDQQVNQARSFFD